MIFISEEREDQEKEAKVVVVQQAVEEVEEVATPQEAVEEEMVILPEVAEAAKIEKRFLFGSVSLLPLFYSALAIGTHPFVPRSILCHSLISSYVLYLSLPHSLSLSLYIGPS